jgi:hypothetical protein
VEVDKIVRSSARVQQLSEFFLQTIYYSKNRKKLRAGCQNKILCQKHDGVFHVSHNFTLKTIKVLIYSHILVYGILNSETSPVTIVPVIHSTVPQMHMQFCDHFQRNIAMHRIIYHIKEVHNLREPTVVAGAHPVPQCGTTKTSRHPECLKQYSMQSECQKTSLPHEIMHHSYRAPQSTVPPKYN